MRLTKNLVLLSVLAFSISTAYAATAPGVSVDANGNVSFSATQANKITPAPLTQSVNRAHDFSVDREINKIILGQSGQWRPPGSGQTIPLRTRISLSAEAVGRFAYRSVVVLAAAGLLVELNNIWNAAGMQVQDNSLVHQQRLYIGGGGAGFTSPAAACESLAAHWSATLNAAFTGTLVPSPEPPSAHHSEFACSKVAPGGNPFISTISVHISPDIVPASPEHIRSSLQNLQTMPENAEITVANAFSNPQLAPALIPELETAPIAVTFPGGVTTMQIAGTPQIQTALDTVGNTVTATTTTTVNASIVQPTPQTAQIQTQQEIATRTIVTSPTGQTISDTTQTQLQLQPQPQPGIQTVRIDEANVPRPVVNDAEQIADGIFSRINRCVSNLSDCIPALPNFSFAINFPTSCSVVSIPVMQHTFNLDMCQYKPAIHNIMSMIWAFLGLFGAIRLLSWSA